MVAKVQNIDIDNRAFQFFASRNVQRIEIRWNNMLPSLRLLLFRIQSRRLGKISFTGLSMPVQIFVFPRAIGSITYSRVGFQSHAKT